MTKKAVSRKKHGFFYGAGVYGIVLLGLGIAAIIVFCRWLYAYEASRSYHVLDAYTETLDNAHIRKLAANTVKNNQNRYQSDEDILKVIDDFTKDGVVARKNSAKSDDEKMTYMLVSGGRTIGSFEMLHNGEEDLGFKKWTMGKEEADFSFLLDGGEIIVPSTYTVLLNGVTLDEQERTVDRIEYDELKEYYRSGFAYDFPYKVKYEVSGYFGEPEFTVLDEEGNEVDIASLFSVSVTDNCTEKEKKEISKFLKEFIEKYFGFLASRKNMASSNYNALKPYLLDGSKLKERASIAVVDLNHSQNRGSELTKVTINSIMSIGDNSYMCDITYDSLIEGPNDTIESTTNSKIIVVKTSDGYFASELENY